MGVDVPNLPFSCVSLHAMVGIQLLFQVVLFGSEAGSRTGPKLGPERDPKRVPKWTEAGPRDQSSKKKLYFWGSSKLVSVHVLDRRPQSAVNSGVN